MTYLVDSNIFIYAADTDSEASRFLSQADSFYYASVTRIEVLGYHSITAEDQYNLRALFSKGQKIRLSDAIENKAIELREQRNISLGDAIIAATALLGNHTFVTRNSDDFQWIESLEILNPYAQR